MAEASDYEPYPIGMRTPDGTPVVYPVVRRRRRIAPSLTDVRSSWAGTYGGPIAERALMPEEQSAAHLALLGAVRGNVDVLLPPTAAEPPADLPCERVPDATQLIRIETDFEGHFSRFSMTYRKLYRRGLRRGITVRRLAGPDAVKPYLEMYESSIHRWGKTTTVRHPPEVFERLGRLGEEAPEVVRVTFAEREGAPLAGLWSLHWRGHAVAWAAASHDPPKALSPMNVIYAELLREVIEEGAELFDFNPSGDLQGVQRSKSDFGAERVPVWRLRARRRLATGSALLINTAARLRRR